jgi:hypothetical protein
VEDNTNLKEENVNPTSDLPLPASVDMDEDQPNLKISLDTASKILLDISNDSELTESNQPESKKEPNSKLEEPET